MMVLLIVTGIVALGGAMWFRTSYDPQQPIVNTSNHVPSISSSPGTTAREVRFTGTITAVKDLRPTDGSLSIEVDGNVVDLGGGEVPKYPKGSVIGLDLKNPQSNIGKKVEVFARLSNPRLPNYSTIVGDGKYYVKAVP